MSTYSSVRLSAFLSFSFLLSILFALLLSFFLAFFSFFFLSYFLFYFLFSLIYYILPYHVSVVVGAYADKLAEVANMRGIRTVRRPKRQSLLNLLTRTRDLSLEVIEAVCMWRDNAGNSNLTFLWKGTNYLLKMVNDLDFMGNTQLLYESLGIPRDRLFSNPLMLPSSILEAAASASSAEERARLDARGDEHSEYFKERLRIRRAECVLIQVAFLLG